MTDKHKETAKKYFQNNPVEDVLHISTDGQVFFQKNYNDAVNHQRRIAASEKLVTIYRKEKTSAQDQPDDNEDETPTEKWKVAEIIEWLNIAGVETTGKETKAILLEKVAEVMNAEDGGNQDENDQD